MDAGSFQWYMTTDVADSYSNVVVNIVPHIEPGGVELSKHPLPQVSIKKAKEMVFTFCLVVSNMCLIMIFEMFKHDDTQIK